MAVGEIVFFLVGSIVLYVIGAHEGILESSEVEVTVGDLVVIGTFPSVGKNVVSCVVSGVGTKDA